MSIKRFICVICVLITISGVLAGCSNSGANENETSTIDSIQDMTNSSESTTGSSSQVFYDRDGKAYSDLNELPYYAEDGSVYHYGKEDKKACFIDSEGKTYDVNKCFINPAGYFVYDDKDEITLDESALSATGKDGITYFPAVTIRWTVDHKMALLFGFGKEIEMIDYE